MEDKQNKKVVTRFAPSPTGFLHIGGVRSALFNYLFAKKHGGTYLLRIDDTDLERSKKEFETDILTGFKKLGLNPNNAEPIRQSERLPIYKKYLEKILAVGFAYVSKEETEEQGKRSEVIRFKNPNKETVIKDLIRGEVRFNTMDLEDFVIAKSLDEPIYHFASVIDDFELGITHVIRGEEHLSNTPRQMLIQEAIGAPTPEYAHLPLILAPDRSKLSKRHGAVALTDYLAKGYLPESIINFLALLGWNPGGDREVFSLAELVEVFDLGKVHKSGAVFNIEKLDWFNRHYIQKLPPEEKLKQIGGPFAEKLRALKNNLEITGLMTERIANFGELREELLRGDYDYFFGAPVYDKKIILWKGEPDFGKTKARLSAALGLIIAVPASGFTKDKIKNAVWPFAEKEGKGEVLWPLRVALSGKEKSPDPFTLAELIGREEAIKRLETAIKLLE